MGVLLAIATPELSSLIEQQPTQGFPLFSEELAATHTFHVLFWTYTALGVCAIALAIAAYLSGGFARMGRVGLTLGIAAVAWKYVIYAVVIVTVLLLLGSGIGS